MGTSLKSNINLKFFNSPQSIMYQVVPLISLLLILNLIGVRSVINRALYSIWELDHVYIVGN